MCFGVFQKACQIQSSGSTTTAYLLGLRWGLGLCILTRETSRDMLDLKIKQVCGLGEAGCRWVTSMASWEQRGSGLQKERGQGGRQVEVTLKSGRKGGEDWLTSPLRASVCRFAQGSQTEDGAKEEIRAHRVAAKALIKVAESYI